MPTDLIRYDHTGIELDKRAGPHQTNGAFDFIDGPIPSTVAA